MAHNGGVIAGLVVDAEARARPVVPSATQPIAVHPEGRGSVELIIPGVGGVGSHVGLVPFPTQSGLQPGSAARGGELRPTDSSTISSSA